jgi:hypothetical protein
LLAPITVDTSLPGEMPRRRPGLVRSHPCTHARMHAANAPCAIILLAKCSTIRDQRLGEMPLSTMRAPAAAGPSGKMRGRTRYLTRSGCRRPSRRTFTATLAPTPPEARAEHGVELVAAVVEAPNSRSGDAFKSDGRTILEIVGVRGASVRQAIAE